MTVTVLDASAVLCYLQGEPGADAVAEKLSQAIIGAANWSEVLSRFSGAVEMSLVEGILSAQGALIEPVGVEDARGAAALRDSHPHLSLGDRLCLALADRLDSEVLTADRAWGTDGNIRQIRG